MATAIQWTDVTDNIIVVEGGGWWCRMISEGCVNCYAAKLNQSDYFGGNKLAYTGEPPKLKLRTDILEAWPKQTKPKKHFVASMTDIFGDWVPINWAYDFLDHMAFAPKQTFQLLTKRADVAKDYIGQWLLSRGLARLPTNIWMGVSVENQKRADERIPILLQIPAHVRFLSVEPMLEAVKIPWTLGALGIHWVIFGGESGPNARPCSVQWIRDGVRQCQAAGVVPFVKQFGSNAIDGSLESNLLDACGLSLFRDKKGGDMSEFPKDLQVRGFPL